MQEVLAGIYTHILGVERVSANDSFFDLGGDSLSAMRLIAAANTTLNTNLRVTDLFDTPTLTALAHRITTHTQPAPHPNPSHRHRHPPIRHPRHQRHQLALPNPRPPPHHPPHRLHQTLTPHETPPHTLQQMAKNYAHRLITTHPHGPYHLIGWSFGGALAHQIAIELHHQGHTNTRLILLDAHPTLPPTTNPPDHQHTLHTLLTHHHTTIPKDLLPHITTNHNHNITLYQHHHPTTYPGPTLIIAAEHTPHLRKPPPQSRLPPPHLATPPHRTHHHPLHPLHPPPTPPPQHRHHLHPPHHQLPPIARLSRVSAAGGGLVPTRY
ncbi:thioesterase domain-containing protein [Mycobacterium sp. Z3061]|uniref:thioesterase domain-containing protein n=1 Tax=Mycobacterium sp. Z3061 TaxID=3073562 RepID=UPI002877B9CC|nr:thioesterase domain-containing protein [Mycobacterium sp. Z3061]